MNSNKHPTCGLAFDVLTFALSLKRPHGGRGVNKLSQFLKTKFPEAQMDAFGNLHLDNRGHIQNRTLFVAHLDTVHRHDGVNKLIVKDSFIHARGDVLGADDGVGIALLCHLIDSDIGGYYIFTQGEECGGLGARYLAGHHAKLLSEFDRAVAFDRRGTSSVITHQSMSRCCSEVFAESLSDALNSNGMLFMPDSTGSYTDTADFTHLIAECTNISCGYFSEHTKSERIDLNHFGDLLGALPLIQWDSLPVERNPAEKELWYLGYESSDALDPAIAEMIEALDSAWVGDDLALKSLMVTVLPKANQRLALDSLRTQTFSDDVLDTLYDNIGNVSVDELLSWALQMTDPALS